MHSEKLDVGSFRDMVLVKVNTLPVMRLVTYLTEGSENMAHVPRVKYFTEDRKKLINPNNWKKYEKYLQSNIIKNQA